MLYHNLHTEFYNNLREYYQKSKHIYLDREFNYKTFTTVLRQLCKYTQITFDSCIKYKNSIKRKFENITDDTMFEKFLDNDANNVLQSYFNSMSKQMAKQKT